MEVKSQALVLIAERGACTQKAACKIIGITERTCQRWQEEKEDQRRGPVAAPANKLTQDETDQIISISNSAEFKDKSPHQIVPKLADRGNYIASESSFYRTLKVAGMLNHRGKSKPRTVSKPKALEAYKPNQIYSWDITYLLTLVRGQYLFLYLFMDIFSRKIVGWEIHERESADLSSKLLTRICEREGIEKRKVTLHADNGGPMKGSTILATMQRLGVIPSFSRPSVSDDNPFSESLFKTLKYCPFFPSKPFSSIDGATEWMKKFVQWYNHEHLHSGIKFVTPASRHAGLDQEILNKRNEIYKEAQQRNPNRWSKQTRNWNRVNVVELNCLKKKLESVTSASNKAS